MKKLSLLLPVVMLTACFNPERDCTEFKDGEFRFTTTIEGEEKTTTFTRRGDLEIDYFEGKADSASIRWINDCEYIVRKLNPENRAEEKAVHMKILSTSDDSYTFEYSIVGSAQKSRGTAYKIE